MPRPRMLGLLAGATGLLVLQGLLVAAPSSAHEHPTPVERAAPAVVFVQTRVKVEISLIEHDIQNAGKHILLHQFSYSPVLKEGSGFAVDPSGTIVTAGEVVTADIQKAENFAVNAAFHDYYHVEMPQGSAAFEQQEAVVPAVGFTGDSFVNQRLHTCYVPNTTDRTGGCVIATTREVTVYPSVTSQQKYGALPATVLTPGTGDVAVLKVGASSMPTVDLAQSLSGAHAITVLGYTGIPPIGHPLQQLTTHFTKAGSGIANETGEDATSGFFRKLVAGLSAGMAGGPIVAEKGQVVGLFPPASPGTPLKAVDAAAIRQRLAGLKPAVTPQRGPTDTAFESAMHRFKNDEFQASIPGLQQTLKLYAGHLAASTNLAIAKAKAGTSADKSGQGLALTPQQQTQSSSGPKPAVLWIILGGVGVLLLAVLAALLLRRRRHRTEPSAAASAPASPGPLGPVPAQKGPVAGPGPKEPVTGPGPKGPVTGPGPKGAVTGPGPAAARPGPAPGAPSGPATGARSGTAAGARPGTASTPGQPAPAGAARSGAHAQRPAPSGVPGQQPSGDQQAAPARRPDPGRVSVMSSPEAQAQPGADGRGAPAGEASPKPTFCTSCGQRLAPNHRFCGYCGERIG